MKIPFLKTRTTPTELAVESIAVDVDDRSVIRLGFLILIFGLGGFFLWAAWAPLDQGVPGSGVVAVINERQVVQHQQGGLVDAILVREGEAVKAGQVLVRLNTTDTLAQLGIVRAQYLTAKSSEARLLAELEGKSAVSFPDEIFGVQHDPAVETAKALQISLFRSRRSALESELATIRENIAGQEHQLKGLEQSLQVRREQLDLIRQQLESVRELAEAGYYPKNRMLELGRSAAELGSSVDETTTNIGRVKSGIAEWKYKAIQRQQEYRKEVESGLSELQKEVTGLKNKLDALEFVLGHADIRSPAEGLVVGMNIHTQGGVIPPGGKIMDIVPSKDPLIVEAKFSPSVIDKLRPDLVVDLRFSSLSRMHTPVIEGSVMTVSADQLLDEATRQPYFLARVRVTTQGYQELKKYSLEIQPGMPVEVLVRTGERTMLNYLIRPLKERMAWAFTEE